jgi:hypothetical protein
MRKVLWAGLCIIAIFSFAHVKASYAGDAFVKGGIILRPSEDLDVSDRYLISFGSDYPIAEYVGLGFEIATAYYHFDFGEDDIHQVPLNGWVNVKATMPMEGLRPFAKAGMGVLGVLVFGEVEDQTSDVGIHFTGGIEFGALGGTGFIAELQWQKAFDEDRPYTVILMGGVKF